MILIPIEVWLSVDAIEDRERLSPRQDRKLLWWRDRLRGDPMGGDAIAKRRIPRRLRQNFGIDNLWRGELPDGWRLLYTIVSRPGTPPEVHILRLLSHKEYDRLLGYG